MWIDLGIVGLVLVFGLVGLASGFWSQFLRLIAIASLYFVAPPIARFIREPLAGNIDVPLSGPALDGLSLIVAAFGAYSLISILIFIGFALAGRKRKSMANKFFGFALGSVKGAAFGYLLLCGFLLVSRSDYAEALDPQVVETARSSHLVDLVAEANLLDMMGYDLPDVEEVTEFILESTDEVPSDEVATPKTDAAAADDEEPVPQAEAPVETPEIPEK